MTIRNLIIQELDQIPESALPDVLNYIRQLKDEPPQTLQERIWQAYLDSEQEREEVYQRLADS